MALRGGRIAFAHRDPAGDMMEDCGVSIRLLQAAQDVFRTGHIPRIQRVFRPSQRVFHVAWLNPIENAAPLRCLRRTHSLQ